LLCRTLPFPGKTGHNSLALSHTVTMRSNSRPAKSLICRGMWFEMSTPASFITATARSFNLPGFTPAENAIKSLLRKWLAHPSAIWLRQEFPVQRNKTFLRSSDIQYSLYMLEYFTDSHYVIVYYDIPE